MVQKLLITITFSIGIIDYSDNNNCFKRKSRTHYGGESRIVDFATNKTHLVLFSFELDVAQIIWVLELSY